MNRTLSIPNWIGIHKVYFFLVIFLLCSFAVMPQTVSSLEFNGKAIKKGEVLEGAKIEVYRGSEKLQELLSAKNGRFSFDVDLGYDYKVTFSYPGCTDMFLLLYGSQCPANKQLFPVYAIDINFFEYGASNVDYAHFVQLPFTKIVYDGNSGFKDDEKHVSLFLKGIYITPDELQKREEELLARHKLQTGDSSSMRANNLHNKYTLSGNNTLELIVKESTSFEERKIKKEAPQKAISISLDELNYTAEKERKRQLERQNKSIKANFEGELLSLAAHTSRKNKLNTSSLKKEEVNSRAIAATLQARYDLAASSEVNRTKAKQLLSLTNYNKALSQQEILRLIKETAHIEGNKKSTSASKLPTATAYYPETPVISTVLETHVFRTNYIISIESNGHKTIYRKEKYTWGTIYYYRNNHEISEEEYNQLLNIHHIPL